MSSLPPPDATSFPFFKFYRVFQDNPPKIKKSSTNVDEILENANRYLFEANFSNAFSESQRGLNQRSENLHIHSKFRLIRAICLNQTKLHATALSEAVLGLKQAFPGSNTQKNLLLQASFAVKMIPTTDVKRVLNRQICELRDDQGICALMLHEVAMMYFSENKIPKATSLTNYILSTFPTAVISPTLLELIETAPPSSEPNPWESRKRSKS